MEHSGSSDDPQQYMPGFDMPDYVNHQDVRYNPTGMDLDTLAMNSENNARQPEERLSGNDLDALNKMFALVADNEGQSSTELTPAASLPVTPLVAPITGELLEQMKLQQFSQLQQMQNQIFHHQMELLKLTQNLQAGMGSSNQVQFQHGLPTPMHSHNLLPQIPGMQSDITPADLVSPLLPLGDNPYDYSGSQAPTSASTSAHTSPNPFHHAMSAPASLAFRNPVGGAPLPSPATMEFDLSPIPSPWLGPIVQSMQRTSHSIDPSLEIRKRSNPSHDDEYLIRKRQSPSVRAVGSTSTKRSNKVPSSSSTPTPPGGSAKRRKSTSGAMTPAAALTMTHASDTPSPVDLSMPPPSAPASQFIRGPSSHGSSNAEMSSDANSSASPITTSSIEPVTPASIMGLAHPHAVQTEQQRDIKGKTITKGKTLANGSVAPSSSSKSTRKTPQSKSVANTALKHILPDGVPPSAALALASQSNAARATRPSSLNLTPTLPPPQPIVQVRKTSHKAAEQKRRDSLKTSFDDLRMLLPPIPLPTEEGFATGGEPPLPGSLPPRGPPKGEPEGPNRHVSKLQLLRCGNEFIRQLKGRVDRRDAEIRKLRSEIMRLRLVGGEEASKDIGEYIDLEKDLDAEERELERARRNRIMSEEEGDEDGDID